MKENWSFTHLSSSSQIRFIPRLSAFSAFLVAISIEIKQFHINFQKNLQNTNILLTIAKQLKGQHQEMPKTWIYNAHMRQKYQITHCVHLIRTSNKLQDRKHWVLKGSITFGLLYLSLTALKKKKLDIFKLD